MFGDLSELPTWVRRLSESQLPALVEVSISCPVHNSGHTMSVVYYSLPSSFRPLNFPELDIDRRRRFHAVDDGLCPSFVLFSHRPPLQILCPSPYPGFRSIPRAALGDFLQDAGATAIALTGTYGLVLGFNTLATHNLIQQSLSRKLVHITSGLLYVVAWPFFSTSPVARYFASVVPFVNCLRLVVYGLSLYTDEGLIKSVTREGKPEELLRGPLYYVLILFVCAIVFWRESPVGVISLAMMCGGDGIADIMGRRFGSVKLPYNQQKSWVGSISMFVFGFLISVGLLHYYSALGYFQLDWSRTVRNVAIVAMVATVVESLSITEKVDDNISVPLASMAAALIAFRY